MKELNKKRIYELDGLRGVAALAVVFYHYTTRFSIKFNNDIISNVIEFNYGHYGVQLFFVISGFVIFMSIEKVKSPFEFLYKRFVRLYPTFWMSLFLTFFLLLLFGPDLIIPKYSQLLVNLTMVPKIFGFKAVDGVYWTLMVELFFYLLIFILLLIKKIKDINKLSFLYLLFGFIFIVFNETLDGYNYFNTIIMYYLHGLLFVMGIYFYKLWKYGNDMSLYFQLLLILIISFLLGNFELGWVYSLIFIIFYFLINKKMIFLSFPIFIFFGKISYTLYLIHQNIGHSIQVLLINHNVNSVFILIAVPLGVTLLLSYIITFFFEKNIMRKLNSFYK